MGRLPTVRSGAVPVGGRHPRDPRAVQLSLTEEGREVARRAIDVVQGLLRRLLEPLGGLDGTRAQEFTRDLTALLEAPLDPPDPPDDKEQS